MRGPRMPRRLRPRGPSKVGPNDPYVETSPDRNSNNNSAKVFAFELALTPSASLWSWRSHPRFIYGLDANVIYDHPYAIYGASIGTYITIDTDLLGAAVDWIGSRVEGKMWGAQIGGIYNRADGDVRGLQVALYKNVTTGPRARGIQAAVFKNESLADFTGLQVALFVNETSGLTAQGVFVSAMTNWNDAELTRGIEVSLANLTSGTFQGLQIGGVNVVNDNAKVDRPHLDEYTPYGDITGVQVGLINIGGWVKGAQLGVINYARTLSGIQLGVLNFTSGNHSLRFLPGINPGFCHWSVTQSNWLTE